MANVLLIVVASAPPLVGSSVPAVLERFCGERLIDRTLGLIGQAVDGAALMVVGPHPVQVAGGTFHPTSTTDLRALLLELASLSPEVSVGLAVDPRYPALTAGTLRSLVASARAGQVAAAGRSRADLAAMAMPLPVVKTAGDAVTLAPVPDRELVRVDSRQTLVDLERQAYLDRAHDLLAAGLLVRDPATTRIDGPIAFGVDVEIEPGCALHGPVTLGDRVRIGQACLLTRATLGNDVDIRPFTMIEDATIGERSFVGPYARVRPGTSVGPQGQIGNFVELKAARLGQGNRINHLSFVGDAVFGDHVTIGAGTITCNHDGVRSQSTTIGAGAYVGSGCILVAPLAVGEGATVGAGSTITEDAPSSRLTLARSRQVVVEGWKGFETKRK